MRKKPIIGLGLGLTLGLVPANTTGAQSAPEFEFSGYRIRSDDCPAAACGSSSFTSATALQDFLNAEVARRAALADGNGQTSPGSSGSTGSDDDDDDDDDVSAPAQVVFLDFGAGGSPQFPVLNSDGTIFGIFVDHFYTPSERDEIQARIEADYADFNYVFTQTEPSSGEFTAIRFGDNDAGNITVFPGGGLSILFGRADNIDFRNQNRTDGAFADASFWEFLAQFDPSGGLFTALSGIPATASNLQDQVSLAVVNQSANTGAHELGHIQGLRHHDSFGAPGDGLPTTGTPAPGDFIPIFEGPINAVETTLHTMASGASVGLTLTGSTITDRFFSERSAVKISVAERGKLITEQQLANSDDDDDEDDDDEDDDDDGSQRVQLKKLSVPNTIIDGVNQDAKLKVTARVVQGDISQTGEMDTYRFKGKAGEFMNVEMVSFSDDRFVNPVIGAITLSLEEKDGSLTPVASNIQTFEPFDPLIFDAPLPANGDYVITVEAPNFVFIDLDGDGVLDPFPLDETGNGAFRNGDYELHLYMCNKKLGKKDLDDDDDDDDFETDEADD